MATSNLSVFTVASTGKLTKSIVAFLSKRFPFAVFYTVRGETVFIRAVVDCRRDPAWIRERLK